MKKVSIKLMIAGLLLAGTVQAQSIQDGVSDLYAGRLKSAQDKFGKMVASNPNNVEATYWLGQAHLEQDDVAGAKALYEKSLLASANAPLVIVGMGQVELMENKVSEARQRFESAIAMTKGKKGDDPEILNAVGRAITEVYTDKEKKGDINYAIEKLQAAAARDAKNPYIYVNLGNAYRKARPGVGGGQAYQEYQKALEANNNFALASYRMAQLFYSQKNWELYEKHLNDAIQKDPKFAPAYYDLSYYKMGKLDFAAAEANAKLFADNSDPDPSNEYLRASILYFQKSYDPSIELAKSIISRSGDKPNPQLYKLIAYNLVDKKDTAAAKPFVDDFFKRVKQEDVTAIDYNLKANVYSAIPGAEDSVVASYVQGVAIDTVVDNKVDALKKGIAFFAERKMYEQEAQLQALLLTTKPKLVINDYFAAGIANYRAKQYAASYDIFKVVADSFPDQIFGWEWKFNNASIIDTVKKDSIATIDAENLLKFAQKDSAQYAKQISSSSYFLATYWLDKRETAKAIDYLKIMRGASKDPAVIQSIDSNIEKLSKPQPTAPARPATPKTAPKPKTGG